MTDIWQNFFYIFIVFSSDDIEMVSTGFKMTNSNAKICKFFLANRKCHRGDYCKFLHALDAPIGKSHLERIGFLHSFLMKK